MSTRACLCFAVSSHPSLGLSIGGTALLFASVKGHERVVETLCRRGADVRVQVPAASVG